MCADRQRTGNARRRPCAAPAAMLIAPMRARVVYFDHASSTRDVTPPFAAGEAGVVWVEPTGELETDTRVWISPNSLHALHGLGVVARLDALSPSIGAIGSGRDALLGPHVVEKAMRVFYEADRATYGVRHDLLVRTAEPPACTEYRIVVDNREYQRTLSQLQFLTSAAARHGLGVRLRV